MSGCLDEDVGKESLKKKSEREKGWMERKIEKKRIPFLK